MNNDLENSKDLLNKRELRTYLEAAIHYLVRHDKKFSSFRSSGYMQNHELEYKKRVYGMARQILGAEQWKKDDIGKGKILDAVIAAVEQKDNNFVEWHNWRDKTNNEHKSLCLAKQEPSKVARWEGIFYKFYKEDSLSEENAFNEFLNLTKRYPLIAYFFFIKDKDKYVPIKPRVFDEIFKDLRFPCPPHPRCAWENYRHFLNVVTEVQRFLQKELDEVISLLDAHSFLFLIQYPDFKKGVEPADISKIPLKELKLGKMPKTPETPKIPETLGGKAKYRPGDEEENRRTGRMAESIVCDKERFLLEENGRPDLMANVKDVSEDCIGYDVLSFELDGSEKYIEVKGSKGKCRVFHLTRNELQTSLQQKNFYLYLVSDVFKDPKIDYIKEPKFKDPELFKMTPTQYEVTYTPEK